MTCVDLGLKFNPTNQPMTARAYITYQADLSFSAVVWSFVSACALI